MTSHGDVIVTKMAARGPTGYHPNLSSVEIPLKDSDEVGPPKRNTLLLVRSSRQRPFESCFLDAAGY